MLNRRVVAGLAGNAALQGVNAIIQFVGIPLCLMYWGERYYGEWLLMFTIPGYLNVSDIGIGTTATVEMSVLEASGQVEQAGRLLRSSFWFVAFWSVLPFGLLLASGSILDWYTILGLEEISRGDFSLAFLLLVFYTYLTVASSVPLNFFRVIRAYHVERYFSAIHKGLEFLALFGVLLAGGGVGEVALAFLLLRLAYLMFLCRYLARRTDIFSLRPIGVDRSLLRHVLRPGFSSLSLYLGGTVLTQGMSTAVGIVLGPVQLVVFSTVRTLVNILKQAVNMLNHSVFAEYTYAFSRGDGRLMQRLYKVNLGIILIIGIASGTGLFLFGQPLLAWWTRGVLQVDPTFFVMMVIFAMIGIVSAFYMTIIMATNHYKRFGVIYLGVALLCVAINPALLRWGGLAMTGASLVALEVILLVAAVAVVRPLLRSMEGFVTRDEQLA